MAYFRVAKNDFGIEMLTFNNIVETNAITSYTFLLLMDKSLQVCTCHVIAFVTVRQHDDNYLYFVCQVHQGAVDTAGDMWKTGANPAPSLPPASSDEMAAAVVQETARNATNLK
jgi:hypothetical protein